MQNEKTNLVEVVLDRDHPRFRRLFTYSVPAAMEKEVEPGSRVWVSLGQQRLAGYVVELNAASNLKEVKDIEQVLGEGPVFSPELVFLARWMAEYYLCPLIRVLKAMLPPPVTRAVRNLVQLVLLTEDEWTEAMYHWEEIHPAAAVILDYLKKHGETPVSRLSRLDPEGCRKTLDLLISQGLVVEQARPVEPRRRKRQKTLEASSEGISVPVLNREQEEALEQIIRGLDSDFRRPVLLHGVTASGKTEIYLKAVQHVLDKGKGAMVLVPEISLTPQMTELFKARFGRRVAVMHSRMTGAERRQEWNRLREGEAEIVIGARSAVFAPVKSLGLIVLDEEHEVSYKQDSTPRYHCREVAQKRAELAGALLVLGSATPSIESFYRTETGQYSLLHLSQRVESRPLPRVSVVDMREEMREGNRTIFSRRLQECLRQTWERGEQAILFLNRRGFASFVVCRNCGLVMRCSRCDVALTYHQTDRRLHCHYCHQQRQLASRCPECGSNYLRQFGLGTQRVEEEARKLLPEARIARADIDTLSFKTEDDCLARFKRGEEEILVGTQMIAKGLDFPRVTLVGVITADISLNQPDFRSGERTFQLLTQVAGRAGRGEIPGEVVIQTYSPQHYSLLTAQEHDYGAFYRAELQYRREWGYPPYSEMVRVLVSGPVESGVRTGAELLGRYIEAGLKAINNNVNTDHGTAGSGPVLLGPAPAPLSRIKGQFRWQMVLKGELDQLRAALRHGLEGFQNNNPSSRINISIDVQPYSML